MGLYSSKNISYGVDETMAIDLNTVEESTFDSFDEAAIMAVVESEQNYNALMKAVGIAELNHFEENGTELVYTEGTVSGFFAKLKEFFKKIIAKVASVLKAFFAKIDSFAKSDKDFLNKYRKDLTKLNLKDMKVNGYKFTIGTSAAKSKDDIANAVKTKLSVTGELKTAVDSLDDTKLETLLAADDDDAYETFLDNFRKGLLGASSPIESGDFAKELYEHFRNGESSKEEIDVDIVAQMQVLAKYDEAKKNAEKAFRVIEKACNEVVKDLEKAEKTLLGVKGTDAAAQKTQGLKVRAVNTITKYFKGAMGCNTTYFGAYLQAMKDESRQAKAICVKALTYKPKNESAGVDYGTTGSFLENVEFN